MPPASPPPLLLGATGFLGRHVAAALTRRGAPPEAPDRYDVDLADPADVRALLAGAGPRVVHVCAGALPDATPLELAALNNRLPVLLSELLAPGSTLVLAGSVAEVGGRDVSEDAPCHPSTPYGRSKHTGHRAALRIGPTRGLRVVIPRFFQLYGPGEAPHRLLPTLLRAARSGRPVDLSSGTQLRDFTFVDDAAEVMAALGDHADAAGVINVATGILTPVRTFAEEVAAGLDMDPALLRWGRRPAGPHGEDPWAHDPVPLDRLGDLGIAPPATDVPTGVRRALETA